MGCAQEDLPQEEDNSIKKTIDEEISFAPSNFFYTLPTAIYFKDNSINPNVPSLEGSLSNLSFSVSPPLPSGLTINNATGLITGTPTILQERENYTISVRNDFGLVSYTISIRVSVPPPSNLRYNLTDETYFRGISIGTFTPLVEGEVQFYTIDPSLPQGLEFNSENGMISGNPTSLLSRRLFTVRAHNGSGFSEFQMFLRVIDVAPSNLVYDVMDATYSVNQTIVSNSPSSSGGAIDLYVIDPVDMPPGLFFNSNNGRIEGKPLFEVPSAINYRITAFNTGGSTFTDISIRVFDKAPPSPDYLNKNINYTKGIAITPNTVDCSGSRYNPETCPDGRPTHFTISPELPSGLFLNPNNGTIYGEPSELSPASNYLVTASNSGGVSIANLNISVIDKPPYLLRYSDSNFKIRRNEPFTKDIINNEGGPVINYAIVPLLPSGLSFNTETGRISGIPASVQSNQIYTVTGENSGGSFSFLINLEVLPIPNYNFEFKLLGKERILGQNIIDTYTFEVKNTSLEFDNSVGIDLALPLTITTTRNDLFFLDNSTDSSCLSLSRFIYLSTCFFKISHLVDLETITESFVLDINFSTVISKELFLNDFFDLSPTNLNLSSVRKVINKGIVNHNYIPPNNEDFAQLSNDTGLVSIIGESNALKEDNPLSLVSDLEATNNNIVDYNNDPDNDGTDGFLMFNNLSFSNSFNIFANLNGYDGYCVINPPYADSGNCLLGSFSIPSNKLNASGEFTVSVGVEQGLDSEKTISNEIGVNVFQIKRISKNFAYPKRMVSHKGKLYFSALKDGETINSRKLMSYDPNNNLIKQVVSFGNGDDRAFPVASYGDRLILRARNPNNSIISFYVYDDVQNRIEHLFCQNCQSGGTSQFLLSVNHLNDNESFFSFNNKFYIIANKGVNNTNIPGYLYSYDASLNTIKREINTFYINSSSTENGRIYPESIIIDDNKIIYETLMVNSNNVSSKKLNYFDTIQNKHRYLTNRNGFGENDNLSDPFSYDNKVFYISKGAGDPLLNKPELVYLDVRSPEELKRVFVGDVNGGGKILGVFLGKLFFKMKDLEGDSLFFYDALTKDVTKIYESTTGNTISKVERFSNFDNITEFYFLEYNTETSRHNLMMVKQQGINIIIDKILEGTSGVPVTEDITMFSYKNNTFFSCGLNLENICVHNIANNNLSLIAENIKIYTEPTKIRRNRLEGIVLLNDRVYIGTQTTSRGEKTGIYEICLKGENGCL